MTHAVALGLLLGREGLLLGLLLTTPPTGSEGNAH
jgi:hypothetical protein